MARRPADLTVIIPAYNEAGSVADTVRSLQQQTLPPARIVVVDDCSTDGTWEAATATGAEVMRPPENTGSKAGAQMLALPEVDTTLCMAIDADTTLAPDAIERLLEAFDDPEVAAACGFVLPRFVRTVWERGRYVEYLFAFGFIKQVQDFYERPLISSGCFSAYRTDDLRAAGGWSQRTMAEDMDLTWTFYAQGRKVRFVPDAVSYPIEPHNRHFMGKQLERWSHGFVQNVRLHWSSVSRFGYLRSTIGVAVWDALFASIGYFVLLPLVALFVTPWVLLGYVIDLPVVVVPVVIAAWRRRELGRALASLPAFLLLRLVNAAHMLRAGWRELVVDRPLTVYEKGH